MTERFVIQKRVLIEINTDPQRRCYDGVHAQSAIVWTAWGALEEWPSEEVAQRRLKFWRELNDYAVEARGKVGTLGEFRCRAVA